MAELLDPPALPPFIQRYLNGESMQVLAREYGVSRQTLYNWLLTGIGDQHYEQVVTQAMVARIAEADESLEQSSSPLDIMKARERMRYSRMDFERRRPKLYGPKTETSTDTKLTVIVQRDTQQVVQPRVIEGTVQESPAQPVDIPTDAQN